MELRHFFLIGLNSIVGSHLAGGCIFIEVTIDSLLSDRLLWDAVLVTAYGSLLSH